MLDSYVRLPRNSRPVIHIILRLSSGKYLSSSFYWVISIFIEVVRGDSHGVGVFRSCAACPLSFWRFKLSIYGGVSEIGFVFKL